MHLPTLTRIYIHKLVDANTMADRGSKRAGKTQRGEIANGSRWEEREAIRLIEQKVVKCL